MRIRVRRMRTHCVSAGWAAGAPTLRGFDEAIVGCGIHGRSRQCGGALRFTVCLRWASTEDDVAREGLFYRSGSVANVLMTPRRGSPHDVSFHRRILALRAPSGVAPDDEISKEHLDRTLARRNVAVLQLIVQMRFIGVAGVSA